MDQLSRATRACVLGQAWSTRCPGRLVLGSEGPRGRPAVTGHSVLGPSARGFDQESRETRARVRMPAVSTHFEGDLGPSRRVRGVDLPFGRIRPMPKGPWFQQASRETLDLARCGGVEQLSQGTRPWTEGTRCRPTLPGDSRFCPSARGVEKQSRATRARVPGPASSTRCLWRLGPGSEGRRGRPGPKGDSGPCPRPRGSTRYPGRLWPGSKGLKGGPAVPDHSRLRPRVRRVDQLFQAAGAGVRRPSVSTSSPGCLGPGSEGPCCGPAVPGHSGLCPRASMVDQMSRATRPWVRGPAWSTSCHRPLGPGSECPRI